MTTNRTLEMCAERCHVEMQLPMELILQYKMNKSFFYVLYNPPSG